MSGIPDRTVAKIVSPPPARFARCEGHGSVKGCGRRALWDSEGKPVVVLVAVDRPNGAAIKWACLECIERSGLGIPTEVPEKCQCMITGCKLPRRSDTNYWRLCGPQCLERLRKMVADTEAEAERSARATINCRASDAHASGVLALEPGVKRESSADTIKAITAPPVARKEAECALLGCGRPARIYHCYREPYSTARKFFCSAEHLKGYALTAKQTDGTVQEEVTDEWQTVSTHGGESQAAQLVRERYATWAKRAHKWHAYLERERAWSAHGRLLSVLTGAASTLAAATVAPHFAAGVVGALMIATALIAWRGQVAQSRLESSRAADAWAAADRLAEVYKGLVVELDAVITTCDDFMKREQAEQVLAKSQQIEGAARFGVPEGLRSVLVEVCK